MFTKLQVYNWGPFDAHTFVFDAPLIEIVGENGSGKTTLLDALNVALNLPDQLYEDRSVGSFQRNLDQPAYVALTIKNPQRAATRRAFPGFEDLLTAIVRVKTQANTTRQYAFVNGDVDLADLLRANRENRISWLSHKEYEDRWERAGYRRVDRANRMFDHDRAKKVRKSTPAELYRLFERFTNNAENVAELSGARQNFDKAKLYLREARSEETGIKIDRAAKQSNLDDAIRIVELEGEHRKQERLHNVALHNEALAELEKAKEDSSSVARRRAHILTEKPGITRDIADVTRALGVENSALETFED